MSQYICSDCNKKFDSEESLNQHKLAKHSFSKDEKKESSRKSMKKYVLLFILIIAISLFAYTFFIRYQKPGSYDDFAKCLTEKGAIVYGNDFCQYTGRQLNFFGKSQQYLNYIKCSNNQELCDEKGIDTTPTWEINGTMYEQVQTFERLSAVSGCEI